MYTLKRGGAYDRFIMMVEAFLDRQCEVHCLSLTPIQIPHPGYHNHVISLPFRVGSGLITKSMVFILFPIYSLLIGWRERVNLFVSFGLLYAFLQTIPKWVLKKPMVTLIRGNASFGLKTQDPSKYFLWLNKIIEYLGLMFSNRVITINKAIQEEMIQITRNRKKIKVDVLYNNIPSIPDIKPEDVSQTKVQLGIPQEAKVLVTAGVINNGKNIEILIKCISQIRINSLFLLIIGEGSTKTDFRYQNYLKELTTKLGLNKKVIFTGWLKKEKLWKIFRASDLFILPSRSEGMPNVLLEALGCDIPCLGSNISGIRDILYHGVLMFDPFDAETLARKIGCFLSDRAFFSKISQLCQERKERFIFDWKQAAFKIIIELLR